MRILSIILLGALVGAAIGSSVAYVEVRTDIDAKVDETTDSSAPPIQASENSPRVQVDEPNYNFGKMQRGTSKSHEFIIKNVGTAPLTLRVGPTTCKCTLSDVSEKPVPPGGSATARLEWAAKAENGPFRQSATIFTTDPLTSKVDLTVEGEILATTFVEPRELLFDKVNYGESKAAQVFVMAMLQDDIQVSDPVMSSAETRDKFDVKIEPVDNSALPNKNARRGVRVTVTAKPGLPIGTFNQWLHVKTNLPEAEKLDIPIVGSVIGDISVHGSGWSTERGELMLGSVTSAEGKTAKLNVMIRGADAANVKLAFQSANPPELGAIIGEPKKIKDNLYHVPVEIQVRPNSRPMIHLGNAQGDAGRIVLSTTHPTIKELAINVRFAVER